MLSACNTDYLCIHLPKDILVASEFWQLQVNKQVLGSVLFPASHLTSLGFNFLLCKI